MKKFIKNFIEKLKLPPTEEVKKFKKSKFRIFLITIIFLGAVLTIIQFQKCNIFAGLLLLIFTLLNCTSYAMGLQLINEKFKNMKILFPILAFILLIFGIGKANKLDSFFKNIGQNYNSPEYLVKINSESLSILATEALTESTTETTSETTTEETTETTSETTTESTTENTTEATTTEATTIKPTTTETTTKAKATAQTKPATNKNTSYSSNYNDTDNDIPSGRTVYVTPHGKKYHYNSACGGKNSRPIDINEAKSSYKPCKKCAQ